MVYTVGNLAVPPFEAVILTIVILAFLLGISLGSFLNVVIDRVPQRKSLVNPPSSCDACGARLSPLELVPVFSYLALRGRCRRCSAPVPWRVLAVEIACGLGLAGAVVAYGATATMLFVYLTGLVLLALSVIDIEHGIVPEEIVLPATVAAVAAAVFFPPLGWKSALIGAGIAFGTLLLPAVLWRGGMGWGDVKLAPLLGLVTGFPSVMVGMLAAFVLGGIAAVAVLVLRKGSRKTPLPFVPFLAAGTMAGMIWGRSVAGWYLGLF